MQALNVNLMVLLNAVRRRYPSDSLTAVVKILFIAEMSKLLFDLFLHHCGLDWPSSLLFAVSVVMELRLPSQR